jgi:hypothetical protein
MPYDQGIASRLRAAGLTVVECSGWQTRGSSSFSPRGSVNHHTAGGANGAIPSLNTLIYGRSDLPGPLCNVAQSRESDPNRDKVYVIAAGRANHAGSGGWRGLSGNSSVYGLEIEHTGTSPLSQARQRIAARIHAAMFGGDVSMVCQHFEWTTRKIDAATNVNGNAFRNLVAQAKAGDLGPTPQPKPEPEPVPEEDTDMAVLVKAKGAKAGSPWWIVNAMGRRWCNDTMEANTLIFLGMLEAQKNNQPFEWDQKQIDAFDLMPGYAKP